MSFKYMLSNKIVNDKYQYFPPPVLNYCWWNLQMEYSYRQSSWSPASRWQYNPAFLVSPAPVFKIITFMAS